MSKGGAPTAFPLAWPFGWPRTLAGRRDAAPFHTTTKIVYPSGGSGTRRRDITVEAARRRLSDELDKLGAREVILSTNIEMRLDGQPRSNRRDPDDPGIAVYFKRKDQPIVMACDRWDTCAGNIAAIAGHIEAIRRIERYGVGSLDRVFTGYAALPAPGEHAKRPWWNVLGFESMPADIETVTISYKSLARRHHPDAGGNSTEMAELTAAMAEARAALK